MREIHDSMGRFSSIRETQLPNATFCGVIGIICFALQIFVRAGL